MVTLLCWKRNSRLHLRIISRLRLVICHGFKSFRLIQFILHRFWNIGLLIDFRFCFDVIISLRFAVSLAKIASTNVFICAAICFTGFVGCFTDFSFFWRMFNGDLTLWRRIRFLCRTVRARHKSWIKNSSTHFGIAFSIDVSKGISLSWLFLSYICDLWSDLHEIEIVQLRLRHLRFSLRQTRIQRVPGMCIRLSKRQVMIWFLLFQMDSRCLVLKHHGEKCWRKVCKLHFS